MPMLMRGYMYLMELAEAYVVNYLSIEQKKKLVFKK